MNETKVIKQHFQVSFSFDLIFTSHLFDIKNKILTNLISSGDQPKSKVIIVVDQGVSKCQPQLKKSILSYFNTYQNTLELCGDIIEIPGGEEAKNKNKYIKNVLEKVNEFGIDRHSYIIVIGGGAVIDAVGFAAAIAHRSVRLIRVPTTVLSQNDSGVGVKNGINYFGKKNFLGSFSTPFAVINDDTFLETLDERNWRSGIAEAIKVALIKDLDFFNWIEMQTEELNSRNKAIMNQLIYRCAEIHLRHIQNSGDPFEQGSSRPLDFGHWAAHKLEQLSNYKINHGEAVAVGIALDSTYSYLKGYIKKYELERILDCFLQLNFLFSYRELNKDILSGLDEFREHLGGKLTIMLLKDLGLGYEIHEMDIDLVMDSINYIKSYSSNHVAIK